MPGFNGVLKDQLRVCLYCSNRADGRDPIKRYPYYFCSLMPDGDDAYKRISFHGKRGDINGNVGCKNLKSSGLPANTLVKEILVKSNALAKYIPVDDTIGPNDFFGLLKKYRGGGNAVKGDVSFQENTAPGAEGYLSPQMQ